MTTDDCGLTHIIYWHWRLAIGIGQPGGVYQAEGVGRLGEGEGGSFAATLPGYGRRAMILTLAVVKD